MGLSNFSALTPRLLIRNHLKVGSEDSGACELETIESFTR